MDEGADAEQPIGNQRERGIGLETIEVELEPGPREQRTHQCMVRQFIERRSREFHRTMRGAIEQFADDECALVKPSARNPARHILSLRNLHRGNLASNPGPSCADGPGCDQLPNWMRTPPRMRRPP
ncbi:hypothetical protein CVN68_16115 [Sphingomonas psychrotolerans]|uniref:Uncharacterized protein n=1 Tax=Sphingomonas psychrotolerans TaxID=1327635 RepID=A0A2K8MHD9_9SPHN|nr:hypothetical protein CVN68_16115 [Sphingomonas psychrotolerans]